MFWAFLLACVPAEDTDAPKTEDDSPVVAELAPLTIDSCPTIESGTIKMKYDWGTRKVKLIVPDAAPAHMPVLFAYHGIGDTPSNFANFMDFKELSNEHEMVIVVPEGDPNNLIEWGFMSGGEEDIAIYDDLRTCISEQLDVDLTRFYATGFSAGALWTTLLSTRRADTLAAAMVMSGGTGTIVDYETPAAPIPFLLMWGGTIDTYPIMVLEISFEETTLAFSEELRADEHFVVHCNHGKGHTVPWPAGPNAVEKWLIPHVSGGGDSPFASDELDGFPDYCSIANSETVP
ncbi:MAG: hypothetical protein HN348_14070 [Proteobacteria bacterium]|nr:hypothetical protein [Pseudomonadota bacterium]